MDRELIGPCLDELAAGEGVVSETVAQGDQEVPAVYLVPFHRAERSLASGLLDLLHAGQDRMAAFQQADWDRALAWLRSRTGADLAPEQQEAVRLALTKRVAVLTGGPGCGKSFTVRSIVELAKARKAKIVLTAPTGRAAKRLAELTAHEATTVHRLLQLQPGGNPKYDKDNPLDADLVVADESSMIDLILANRLVRAIPPRRPSAAGRRRGPASVRGGRGGAARLARRHRGDPPGAPDEDLPAGPDVRDRGERAPGQRRVAAAAARLPGLLLVRL